MNEISKWKSATTSTFARGQVWTWEDPTYGYKSSGKEVDHGEATLRYSRYVLIVQTAETIQTNMLVVPLSTSRFSELDPEINIILQSGEVSTRTSYARINSLFPVHPETLKRYVCSVNETTMEVITSAIMMFLVPGHNANITSTTETEDVHFVPDVETDTTTDIIETAAVADSCDNRKYKRYSYTEKVQIIRLYQDKGTKAVMEKYGIRNPTAYINRWVKKIPSTIKVNLQEGDVTKGTNTKEYDPLIISKGIIKLGSMILTDMMNNKPNIASKSTFDYDTMLNKIYSILRSLINVEVDKDGFIIRQSKAASASRHDLLNVLNIICDDPKFKNKLTLHSITSGYGKELPEILGSEFYLALRTNTKAKN